MVAEGARDPAGGGALAPAGTAPDLLARCVAAERLLAEKVDQLARADAELEQFAYVASHDLSEPLRTVAGFVQLIAQRYDGRLDDEADEFIALTLEGVGRMQALLRDLLAYSRVGRVDFHLELVDCGRLVAEVAESFQTDDTDDPDETDERVTWSALPPVLADERHLRRVFQSLIGNGLTYAHPGRPPHVVVSAQKEGPDWIFSVADNGVGISAANRERVFRMFQRLHGQDDFPGTGMGLAITQRIVERHGGRIWVESQEGQGSTFRFTLPLPPTRGIGRS